MKHLWLTSLIVAIIGAGFIVPPLKSADSRPITYYREQVAVLMYHHVHDADQSSSTITTNRFRDQLIYLHKLGYQFITLEQFKRFMDGANVPDNAVLITFDDGYHSFYELAFPILEDLKIPAVNFVITGTLEDPYKHYILPLSKNEIAEMTRNSNLINIQCHTHALHYKTNEGGALLTTRITIDGKLENRERYEKRIINDTLACRNSLQKLTDNPVDSLAYPYGIYSREASDLIHQSGINYAFTTRSGMATRRNDPMQIPRINAGSPWITPEALHSSIIRRVVAFK